MPSVITETLTSGDSVHKDRGSEAPVVAGFTAVNGRTSTSPSLAPKTNGNAPIHSAPRTHQHTPPDDVQDRKPSLPQLQDGWRYVNGNGRDREDHRSHQRQTPSVGSRHEVQISSPSKRKRSTSAEGDRSSPYSVINVDAPNTRGGGGRDGVRDGDSSAGQLSPQTASAGPSSAGGSGPSHGGGFRPSVERNPREDWLPSIRPQHQHQHQPQSHHQHQHHQQQNQEDRYADLGARRDSQSMDRQSVRSGERSPEDGAQPLSGGSGGPSNPVQPYDGTEITRAGVAVDVKKRKRVSFPSTSPFQQGIWKSILSCPANL